MFSISFTSSTHFNILQSEVEEEDCLAYNSLERILIFLDFISVH